MFKWLWYKNSALATVGSLKYILTEDEELACEIEIKRFDNLSSDYFAKLLFLLDQGQLTSISIDALNMLHENNLPEQSNFVEEVLKKMQREQGRLIQPVIRPTDVFKEG